MTAVDHVEAVRNAQRELRKAKRKLRLANIDWLMHVRKAIGTGR